MNQQLVTSLEIQKLHPLNSFNSDKKVAFAGKMNYFEGNSGKNKKSVDLVKSSSEKMD